MKSLLAISLLSIFISTAFSGECVLSVDRKACAGKETDAFKPYQGKNPTEEKKSVSDEAACKSQAEKASKIVRKGVLTSKKVVAKFDGKDAGTFEGVSECK